MSAAAPLTLDAAPQGRLVPGQGHLATALIDRDLVSLTHLRAVAPLALIRSSPLGRTPCVYVSNLGGGLVGGDTIALEAHVGAGASLALLTQASTKVYRSEKQATQLLHATVEDDALFVLVPDVVTPFAGADGRQLQTIALGERASMVAIDWVSAGRSANGERWQFRRWESRLHLTRGGVPILRDALLLDAADGPLGERMGRFDAVALACLVGPRFHDVVAAARTRFGERPVQRRADVVTAASPLADGLLVRVAATTVEAVREELQALLSLVAPVVGAHPWDRRW